MLYKTRLGRCIYQSSSGHQVYQNLGYRWLTLGTPMLQTLFNRRHPERPGLAYIIPLTRMILDSPGDCCLLGLGGAGLAHALCPVLSNATMLAVDNSQEVIDIAARYFKMACIPHLSVVHLDAQRFVQVDSGSYQHVIVDLYNTHDYPLSCSNDAFFLHCKALLKPGGIMAVNILNIQKKIPLFQMIKAAFNDATLIVPVKGTTNTLVFAYNLPTTQHFLENIQHSPLMKRLYWDSRWGYMGRMIG